MHARSFLLILALGLSSGFAVGAELGESVTAPRPNDRAGKPRGGNVPRRAEACIANQSDPGIECLENEDTPAAMCCSGICELRGASNVCCLPLGEPCTDANDCCSSSCFAGACN